VKVTPVRGFRHGRTAGRDVSAVVAPPYDQIDSATHARLLALSPDNVVRITLPADGPDDKYRRARTVLDGWLAEGVWTREATPALYPYAQTYSKDGVSITRTGFIALGDVSDYGAGIVLPHERTHAGPKQDRLHLLEATGADVGLLFMLTSDPDGRLRALTAPTGDWIAEARDLRGEHHRLWRITEAGVLAQVRTLMADRQVIIADGHHRYETAVEYRRRHPAVSDKLMAFFALEAPGLTILANHRLVHGVELARLLRLPEAARPWFDVAPLADPLAFRPTPRTLGVVERHGARSFTLRADAADRLDWPPGTSLAWRALAVSILHEGVLRPLLGITDAHLDARTHVEYTADQGEAVALVRAGRYQAAFLIAATTPDEMRAVVRGGELLPQKSTHFYPKLLDGLVFHVVDDRPSGVSPHA
jgi:uncharacterized protein (DUF1015 family)